MNKLWKSTRMVVENVVGRGCGIVEKMFGFLDMAVRFFTFSGRVEKFYQVISTFGFVRFTPIVRRGMGGISTFST